MNDFEDEGITRKFANTAASLYHGHHYMASRL
jgi:hypothetical protein